MSPRPRRLGAWFLALAIVAPAADVGSRSFPAGGAVHTYLILPFEDSAPDPSREWLREAMALSLADYFLGAGQSAVDRDDRLSLMDETGLPLTAPLTLATSLRLGRYARSHSETSGPDRLVVGHFSLDQGQVTLSARILSLDVNRAGPWKEESANLKDLFHLQRLLAQSLLKSDGVSGGNLGAHSDDADAGHAFPLVAYENYIRGLIDSNSGRQQALLRKAIEQSPGYPKACYQLARILARAGKRAEAEAVLKSIGGEPDPYRAEYHALLGTLHLDAGRLSAAESEAQASLAVRDTAVVRVLRARIARAHGDSAQALQELAKAEAMDPENPDLDSLKRQIEKPAPPHR